METLGRIFQIFRFRGFREPCIYDVRNDIVMAAHDPRID